MRVAGERYHELTARAVKNALARVKEWRFTGDAALVAKPAVGELVRRLEFLDEVGLGYLALDRAAGTLSGGEMQRLRLAAQLGAGLTGALYVLDEPTIGLHPRDTGRLLGNLRRLVDLGSTVLVVEHDIDTIRAADHLVDHGPSGGAPGAHIVAEGTPQAVLANLDSPTARALAANPEQRKPLPVPARSRPARAHGRERAQPLKTSISRCRSGASSWSRACAARARARSSGKCCCRRFDRSSAW